jgi:hypothetical protein
MGYLKDQFHGYCFLKYDFTLKIKSYSNPTLSAHNTSVIISKANYNDLQQMSTHVPSLMYPRFDADQLVLSVEKPNIVKYKTTSLPHYPPNNGLKKYINYVTNKISWYIN